jgi:hypothetical protein
MMPLLRVLWAETLKTKRTPTLAMVFAFPIFVVALMTFLLSQLPSSLMNRPAPHWIPLARFILQLWTVLILPLFITLATALMAGLEHPENQWKNLMALPVPRWTIYIAKLIVVTCMVAMTGFLIACGLLISGVVLGSVEKQLHFPSPVPWVAILRMVGAATGLTFLSVTIQHWVSLRLKSFSLPVGAGIFLVFMKFVIIGAAHGDSWTQYFPWALPVRGLQPTVDVASLLWFGALAGLVVTAAGCWEFCRREVS